MPFWRSKPVLGESPGAPPLTRSPSSLSLMEPIQSLIFSPGTGRRNWRAFQIAFLLMTLKFRKWRIPRRPRNCRTDLVFHGGGKYRGLPRPGRLRHLHAPSAGPKDTGVHVLMRYTLRLLTTQQFQRAARLICAMGFCGNKNQKPSASISSPLACG